MNYDETETCWHILTVTHGGTVSILRNLDAPTARQAYRNLCPDERPTEYLNMPKGGFMTGGRSLSNGTITQVHILGPEGAKLEPWRGVETLVIDLAGFAAHQLWSQQFS